MWDETVDNPESNDVNENEGNDTHSDDYGDTEGEGGEGNED